MQPVQVNVNGVSITLTEEQLSQIDKQVKRKSKPIIERVKSVEDACDELGINLMDVLPYASPKTDDEEAVNSFNKGNDIFGCTIG